MDRLNYFYVRVGDHNETNLKGNALCANYNGTIGERWFSPPYAVVECTQPLRGRFLTVQHRSDVTRGRPFRNALTICEVDIRGYKGKSFRPWFGDSNPVRNQGPGFRRGSRSFVREVSDVTKSARQPDSYYSNSGNTIAVPQTLQHNPHCSYDL